MTSKDMLLAVIASMLTPFACLRAGQDCPKASPTDQVRQPSSGAPASNRKQEADHPLPQMRDWRYQLHLGDWLAISFPLTPEFNQRAVTVQLDGYVTLQARPCRNSGSCFKRRMQRFLQRLDLSSHCE